MRALSNAVPFEGMTGLGKSGTYGLAYDASGRLVSDASRGITHIPYDNDGRPTSVKFSDWTEQAIEWDNLGNHISTRYIEVSYTGRPQDKLTRTYTGDGRVIDNYAEAYARFPGGYYKDGGFYHYVTDYQGNHVGVLDNGGYLNQSTDYYPYGEPWLEPEGQSWLYSGNERLRLNGINEYDFNARRYNSALGCFTTWDPLCEKRPWESPYAFCGGDPVNYSDPSGEDIVVLNYGYGLNQHLAMLIQGGDKLWYYYSINGNNKYSSGDFIGGRPFNDVEVGGWYSPEEFFTSQYNAPCEDNKKAINDKSVNKFAFQEGFRISTTSEQDKLMSESFKELALDNYNLFFNNCAQVVQEVMIEAGVPVASPHYIITYTVSESVFGLVEVPEKVVMRDEIQPVPSKAFKAIIKANPMGVYYKYDRKK